MLQEMAEQIGEDAIPALRDRPELEPHLEFEWRAFRDLSRDRIIGLELGSLWWTSIDAYARRHAIDDPDAFERFALLMQEMDAGYRDHLAEIAKNKSAS
jgi:hypothetical protein